MSCQLFIHESSTFHGEQYVIRPIQTNGTKCAHTDRQTDRHTKVKNSISAKFDIMVKGQSVQKSRKNKMYSDSLS